MIYHKYKKKVVMLSRTIIRKLAFAYAKSMAAITCTVSMQLITMSVFLYLICHVYVHMSRDMTFPTMWYVQLAKPQISLRICAV